MNNKSTAPYWNRLRQVIFSPQFHWMFLKSRLLSNFFTAPSYLRRFFAVLFIVAVLSVVFVTHSFVTFVVAWVFPLTVLYHNSAILEFVSEHLWGTLGTHESKSHARFCGEAPPFGESWLFWLRWIFHMIGHLFIRVAILPGDMPLHHVHHLNPKNQSDWANVTHGYQREVEEGAEYIEIWGLGNAIERVFQGFANK